MNFNEDTFMWELILPEHMKDETLLYIPVFRIDNLSNAIRECERHNLVWVAHTHDSGWYLGFHALDPVSEEVIRAAKGEMVTYEKSTQRTRNISS